MKVGTSFRSRDSVKRWRASYPSDTSGWMYCKFTPSEMNDVSEESFSLELGSCRWEPGGRLGTGAVAVR